MNKTELVGAVAAGAKLTKKDAEAAVNSFIEVVEKELTKGGKVQLIGFGTFETRKRKARTGQNPRKPGVKIQIPASTAVAFKVGKAFKDKVNKKK